jgi:sec-independent protein translocase protein TatC
MHGTPELQTLSPADVFVGYLELSLVTGVIAAAPIIFYQLWSFISPGLYSKEKRYIFPFVFFSTALFLSGVAFAYYVAFPFTFNYFFSLLGTVTESGTELTQRPTLEYYLDFTTRMLLAFGGVFELPLFISFLSIAGIVTPMQLLRFSRWAVILSFVVGAIATPGPEITSQIAVSGALVGLYFISVAVAFVVARKKKEPEPAPKKKKKKKKKAKAEPEV